MPSNCLNDCSSSLRRKLVEQYRPTRRHTHTHKHSMQIHSTANLTIYLSIHLSFCSEQIGLSETDTTKLALYCIIVDDAVKAVAYWPNGRRRRCKCAHFCALKFGPKLVASCTDTFALTVKLSQKYASSSLELIKIHLLSDTQNVSNESHTSKNGITQIAP